MSVYGNWAVTDPAVYRPEVGKHVKINRGEHCGKIGRVVWHGKDQFFRGHWTPKLEYEGRIGYRVKVQLDDDGPAIFCNGDSVTVISD